MGNIAKILMPNGLDIKCDILTAVFKQWGEGSQDPSNEGYGDGSGSYGEEFAVEVRIAEKVVLQAGVQPSYAMVDVPMAAFGPGKYDELVYSVAFNARGPAKLKMNTRCTVYASNPEGRSIPLLVGTVVKCSHGIKADNVIFTVYDDKWMLHKVTCFGQCQYDPIKDIYGFVADEPLIFNRFGFEDCLDTRWGPRFAPSHRFGWKNDPLNGTDGGSEANQLQGEPPPGKAQHRSRSWRVVDAGRYLRDMHYGKSMTKRPPSFQKYGMQTVGTGVNWPESMHDLLHDNAGTERILRNCVLEGLTLDMALSKLGQRAGAFELYCIPNGKSGGGDNGNDAGVGNGTVVGDAFAALQTMFDTNMAGMNAAFNAGYAVFSPAVQAANDALNDAVGVFQSATSISAQNTAAVLRNAHATLAMQAKAAKDAASVGVFKDLITPAYQQYLATVGNALNGSPGHYAMPNGSIHGDQSTLTYSLGD